VFGLSSPQSRRSRQRPLGFLGVLSYLCGRSAVVTGVNTAGGDYLGMELEADGSAHFGTAQGKPDREVVVWVAVS